MNCMQMIMEGDVGGCKLKFYEENSCCINFVAVVSEVNGVCMGRLLERDIIKENIRGIN